MYSTLLVLADLAAHPWAVVGAAAAVYVAACNLLRFRYERQMLARFFGSTAVDDPEARRARLEQMTAAEAQQIVCGLQQREFPYMYRAALQFGIFKTYGVPEISRLLVATQALAEPNAAAKRYQDTVAMFAEFSTNAPTSPRCLAAIARTNVLHRRYIASGHIRNQDLLYTLSACVAEPIRFIARCEWRALNDVERCAMGVFWRGLGDAMQIDYACLPRQRWASGLDFVDDIAAWARALEASGAALRPDPANVAPARRLMAMLLGLVPAPLAPLAADMVAVLMGDRMREAFALPKPGIVACAATYGALVARRAALRFVALPRRTPFRMTDAQPDAATGRIRMNQYLDHPWYVQATWWRRWGPEALAVRLLGGHVPGDERPAAATKRAMRREQQAEGAIGRAFMEDGFLIGEIGPLGRMGEGLDAVDEEVARLQRERTCPFA